MEQREAIVSNIVRSVMFFTTARHARALDIAYITNEQKLTIDLQEDGSAKVSDRLTYTSYHAKTFHHTLHLLDYDVRKLSVSLIDPTTQTKQALRLTDKYEPLSYQITKVTDDQQRLQLNYESQHEKVTFVFEYVIDNFVTTYQDVAVLTTLQTDASIIQEEADFTGTLLLPTLPQQDAQTQEVAISAQLTNTSEEGQVTIERQGNRHMIRVGIPSEAMTSETALTIQVAASFFPKNPNDFSERRLNKK
ncbi:DUF2207 domain-containing protein [Fundicoccus sp. Sow4_F4]|uniref:DUF2207 domain-containing protein n=1 Tax=Fundicoccus sp. Sow4_F4 TaxID=3438783 RepID=UPI003F8FD503